MATVFKLRPVKLVGPKIRQLRKDRNLTQTELSSRIGIQQSDLSRMEKGEYRVSLDTLFSILSEFQMSVGQFFDDMARETMNDRDLELVRRFQSLDEGTRRQIEQLLLARTQAAAAGGQPGGAEAPRRWALPGGDSLAEPRA
jgi:transcriptional regulator with XRE-family HTH domain